MPLQLDSTLSINRDLIQAPDLTDRFTPSDLDRIGMTVMDGYKRDKQSRIQWERRMGAAMNLAMQVQEVKTFPWPGSSNVVFPLITIAALQFSGRTYTNIIQGTDVVRYRVVGNDDNGKIKQRAERIGSHMSWQVMEQDCSWITQHDRLAINISVVGCAWIKTYFDGAKGHNVSSLVMAKDFVLDYWAKSTEECARKTHCFPLYRNEIYERIMMDTFRDVRKEAWFNNIPTTIPVPEDQNRKGLWPPSGDEDTPFPLLEQHRFFDFDKDGYAEPYICTIEPTSQKVLRITARFDDENAVERNRAKEIICIRPTEYFTKYAFIPSPDGGIYDLGFGTFLGPINETVNSGINQLMDNGTMQNSIGGFLGKGAKIRGGNYTMAPWEWKRVDMTGDDIKKAMVPYPERQPSSVMFQLISLLIEYANRIAGTTDEQVGKNVGQNTPASTYQGMQEQGMQMYGMLFKRFWDGMREEFKKLYGLNRQYLGTHHKFGAANIQVSREDYMGSPDQIAPVADPNATSTTMRITQAQVVATRALQVPGYDIKETEKGLLKAMRVEDVDKFYPGADKVPPLPNPKMQVEQLKWRAKQMDLAFKKQELVAKLMQERKLNMAKIHLMEAQAYEALQSAKGESAALQLKAFELALDTLKAHNDMLNERIAALGSEEQGDQGESGTDSDGGGVGRVDQSGGDQGTDGSAGQGANGADQSMGTGGVSEGTLQ